MRCAGHVTRIGKSISTYTVLFNKSEGMRSLERLKRKYEHVIKMNIKYITMDSVELAQDRVH
jgi:hypothetical protein